MSGAVKSDERALWRAVIQQAIADATSFYNATPSERAEARRWFSEADADFVEICGLADLEPDHVRKDALAYIAAYDAGKGGSVGRLLRLNAAEGRSSGRPSPIITHNDLALTAAEWSQRLGIPAYTINARLKRGYPVEAVLSTKRLPRGHERGAVRAGTRPPASINID